jgi:hypothetical protein
MRELSIEEAEKIAGKRLDRRRKYAVDDADDADPKFPLFSLARWTDDCSGCKCDCHPGCGHGVSGCHECGYTGRRRVVMWLPHASTIVD